MLIKTASYPSVDKLLTIDSKWRRLTAMFYFRNGENVQLARPILIGSNFGVVSLQMCVKKGKNQLNRLGSLFLQSYRDQVVMRDDIRISIQRMQGLWCCKFSLKDLITSVWTARCLNTELGCQTRNTLKVLAAPNCKANSTPTLPRTQLQCRWGVTNSWSKI